MVPMAEGKGESPTPRLTGEASGPSGEASGAQRQRSTVVRPGMWPGAVGELRRDDSMSLMRELVTHALDDGYVAAAARKGANQGRSRRGLSGTLVVLALLGLLLTVA